MQRLTSRSPLPAAPQGAAPQSLVAFADLLLFASAVCAVVPPQPARPAGGAQARGLWAADAVKCGHRQPVPGLHTTQYSPRLADCVDRFFVCYAHCVFCGTSIAEPNTGMRGKCSLDSGASDINCYCRAGLITLLFTDLVRALSSHLNWFKSGVAELLPTSRLSLLCGALVCWQTMRFQMTASALQGVLTPAAVSDELIQLYV